MPGDLCLMSRPGRELSHGIDWWFHDEVNKTRACQRVRHESDRGADPLRRLSAELFTVCLSEMQFFHLPLIELIEFSRVYPESTQRAMYGTFYQL